MEAVGPGKSYSPSYLGRGRCASRFLIDSEFTLRVGPRAIAPVRVAAIEILDERERVLAFGRFGTDREGYRQLLAAGGRSGCGRWRAATASAGIWRSDWSPMGRPWWTCRRSYPRGRGCCHVAAAGRPPRRARRGQGVIGGDGSQVRVRSATTAIECGPARWSARPAPPRLLGDIGDVTRFPTRAHFASWNGTAPLDASSGEQRRHRLSRAGNRRTNRVLHIMAVVQLRHETDGRAYYRCKVAAGKTSMEAMRCLKPRLSDVVYRQLVADAAKQEAGPGGHSGATLTSSAAGPTPAADSSDKSTSRTRRPAAYADHRQPDLT